MGESRERRRTSWKQGGRGQEEAAWRPLCHKGIPSAKENPAALPPALPLAEPRQSQPIREPPDAGLAVRVSPWRRVDVGEQTGSPPRRSREEALTVSCSVFVFR